MPRPRIAMRKIREVLRLALGEELQPASGQRRVRGPAEYGERLPGPGRVCGPEVAAA